MQTSININPALFWDIDFEKINYERNAKQVIERVLMYGSTDDWFEIKRYYGLERLKKEVLQIRYLDKLTLNFCNKYFNIPLNQFRCYNTPQSYRKLWDF